MGLALFSISKVPFFMAFTASELTLSHHIPLTCPFLGHVNGVSNRVLVVYLYTTGVGDGNDHTRDYTRCAVISLYGIRPLILSTCGCFMY